MGLFDIFTGKKAVDTAEKVLDAGISGIDKIFYTEEEKAETRLKMGDIWLKTQEALAGESSARSVSRRIIAWSVVWHTLLAFDVCLLLVIFDKEEKIKSVVELVGIFQLGWAFVAVIVFYFGTHIMGKLGRGKS